MHTRSCWAKIFPLLCWSSRSTQSCNFNADYFVLNALAWITFVWYPRMSCTYIMLTGFHGQLLRFDIQVYVQKSHLRTDGYKMVISVCHLAYMPSLSCSNRFQDPYFYPFYGMTESRESRRQQNGLLPPHIFACLPSSCSKLIRIQSSPHTVEF